MDEIQSSLSEETRSIAFGISIINGIALGVWQSSAGAGVFGFISTLVFVASILSIESHLKNLKNN